MSVSVNERNITTEVAQLIESRIASGASLPALRKEAFENFQRLGLPENKAEEYKDTPITRTLLKNFTFQIVGSQDKINPSDFSVPSLEANVIVILNGLFSKEYSNIISPDTELSLLPLQEAVNE